MSIKGRIIATVLVPVLLCCAVMGGFSMVSTYNTITADMEGLSGDLNAAYAGTLDNVLEKFIAETEAIARERGFFDPETTDQDKVALLQHHASNSDVSNMAIFGADGKNIFIGFDDGTIVPPGVADVSFRSYLPEALSGKTVVFGPSKDVVTGRVTVTIATPSNVAGAPKSIVAIDYDLNAINEIMSGATFGATGHSFLLDRNGMFIAGQDQSVVGYTLSELADQDKSYEGLKTAFDTMVQSGGAPGGISFIVKEENYASYRTVEGTDGWILVTAAQTSEYYEDFSNTVRSELLVAGILIVAGVVGAFIIGNSISRPIKAASSRMVALSQGKLARNQNEKGIRRKDEIGTLVRALESANSTLAVYINDISSKLGEMSGGNYNLVLDQEYLGDFAPHQDLYFHNSRGAELHDAGN